MSFFDHYPLFAAGVSIDHASPEALAALPYGDEIRLKNEALRNFLRSEKLPLSEPLVPSPVSRHYRTTGKRRISVREGRVFLHMGRTPGKESVQESSLEPEEHNRIYHIVHDQLSRPCCRTAAENANYCIIRGSEKEKTLILNVRRLSGEIVRSLRFLADSVRKEIPSVISAFLYVDETGSDYYLEAERPVGKLGWKKLFGPETLSLRIAEPQPVKFLYPPTVFSQINESILPVFVGTLAKELKVQKTDQLLDLYCGYGLWSLLLAPEVRSVWGAELSPEAIRAALSNSAYHFKGRSMRYETGTIDADFLREHAPASRSDQEIILLDPPRHGTAPGVIETLIARRPRAIAHIFCGTDEIPQALKIYLVNGCRVKTIIPFDFFPGTLNVETLAVIVPPRSNGK